MFLWIFVIPVIIGEGVAGVLLKIHYNFSEHWISSIGVCFSSGAVVTWFPMVFLVEKADILHKKGLWPLTLLLWVAGFITPLLFGFHQLGYILTILLILSAGFTVTKLASAISEISMRSGTLIE